MQVTLSATDASSGVKSIIYNVDSTGSHTYGSPFSISGLGPHTLQYSSTDVAGNNEVTHKLGFSIESPTTTTVTSSLNPSTVGAKVTFTAKVVPLRAARLLGPLPSRMEQHRYSTEHSAAGL